MSPAACSILPAAQGRKSLSKPRDELGPGEGASPGLPRWRSGRALPWATPTPIKLSAGEGRGQETRGRGMRKPRAAPEEILSRSRRGRRMPWGQ